LSEDAGRSNDKPEHIDRMAGLWRRVYERKIVQWSVAYVALAYGVQHGVVLTAEAFEWPHAVQQASMLLLAVGLPVVVTFAWYHGERASRRISGPELTIIAILLAMGSLFFYVLVRPAEDVTASRVPAGVAAARNAAADPHGAISVAVLPFVNLSSDKEQEFFSDGMTEEITTALAKVPDLRVVGRTSAFQFKGNNKDLRSIGQSLSATHLIEGSVRKAGNRLRITAQLIKADDGTHLWAEDYDRELTDVFAIQEDIARAITASLHMTLGLKPGENLVNNRNIDAGSYEKYLRAGALIVGRGGEPTIAQEIRNSMEAVTLMEEVVAKNPSYAPGWALLGGAYSVHLNNNTRAGVAVGEARRFVEELRPKGEAAIQRALQLDPNQPLANAQQAYFLRSRGKLAEAEEWLKKSLALDPSNSNTLFLAGMFHGSVGRVKEGLEFYEKGNAVDPFYPNLAAETAQERWVSGQNDSAIALAKTLRSNNRATLLALIYASLGRNGEAADSLMDGNPNAAAIETARLLRMMPQKIPTVGELSPIEVVSGANLDALYIYLGASDRALTDYERRAEMGYVQGNRALVWHPSYAPVRKTERFKALMRKVGLFDYWKAKGWPAQCHPTTGDDFACE